jgi:hypothetical protein
MAAPVPGQDDTGGQGQQYEQDLDDWQPTKTGKSKYSPSRDSYQPYGSHGQRTLLYAMPEPTDWRPTKTGKGEISPSTGRWRPIGQHPAQRGHQQQELHHRKKYGAAVHGGHAAIAAAGGASNPLTQHINPSTRRVHPDAFPVVAAHAKQLAEQHKDSNPELAKHFQTAHEEFTAAGEHAEAAAEHRGLGGEAASWQGRAPGQSEMDSRRRARHG